jgi:hypothetical protein
MAAALCLFFCTPAAAFIRQTVSATDATPIRWDLEEALMPLSSVAGGEVIFVIDTAGDPNIPGTEENAAVMRAFQHWEGIGTSRVAFSHGTDQAIQVANNDGINGVYWAAGAQTKVGGTNTAVDGWVSMTPVFYVSSGANKGLILDANIILNLNDYTWTVHPETNPAAFDVEAHITHEIGHFIGLDHSGVLAATMSPRYNSGEARGRVLEKDDQIGASDIYPDGYYGVGTGAISGSIGRPAAVFGALVTAIDSSGRVIEQSITATNGTYRAPGLTADTYDVYVDPIDKVPPSTTNLFDLNDLGDFYAAADPNFFATLTAATSVTPPATTPGVSFLVGTAAPLVNISKIGGRAATVAGMLFSTAPTLVFQGDTNILLGVAGPNLDASALFDIAGPGITDNGVVANGSAGGEPSIVKSFTIDVNAAPGLRSIRVSRGTQGRTYATGAVEIYPAGISMSGVSPGVYNASPGEVNAGVLAGENPVELTLRGADLDIEWDDEPGAYGYHVYRGTLASVAQGTYDHQMIGGNPNGLCNITGSYASLKNEALDPIDRYYLITAYNNAGEGITGVDSNEAPLPAASPACPVP